ncbi:hypothetical protein ASPWEDRAFT_177718 [Aspergillus wentii DTO 134E9]|uniref:Sodium/calcium exchanger membrane region domain-containing protein n=1 Tax=Aspergillus wentii DTO 134E9 TaxID=1073089 RepID=A0A1L9R4Z5_ASPWE|nr:uncharacterized protein ASPWEDRAFT_177718 [Aspergillus wentii DTO 134E9]OJJ29989.1 hypothetical protein ASPWEDRAFT_177718 [Aspergillus wentii DTO 134E9]
MDWDNLCFNTATLIAGVFVLDYGADKFLDHTVIVGRRLGISPTLIALLTAGAEYEELAVVIAAILQHRSPLALGNVMGSAISNILGAFSLGLLCHPGGMEFDRSAKIYAALQLAVTTLFVALAFFHLLNQVTGAVLIAVFVLYIISIGYAIYKGVTEPPQMSDSDSDDEIPTTAQTSVSETLPLLENASPRQDPQPLYQHIFQLLFGLLALSLSGYILAHSAGAIADSLQLSGTVFGLTVIAFATTLPEKLISVLSGSRGQGGIVIATTAGSNIFLLTLCVGVVAIAGLPVNRADTFDTFILFDLVMVWMSALGFTVVAFLGPSRIAGLVFLLAYVAFVVLEFTVYKR